ncbi:MerR family transcriptional regulator [Thermostaphylospora chromogena]|uniref:DNA-binding transcriptional regulator, MerR family n=1 Tax=Thermostaphylospora chromogena TaxID=35622 RepID=A0A1H1EWZ5_9ACTN|nr:MerR family transcriptional regulator [Thermostaphylospora chromogena]SDQ93034.1 DNA-binding transcriptional regulator, MerR family [Thermostaphylospora chromogena]
MELISIGEAARMLGMNTSALRYYEERRLLRPAARVDGRRMYGRDELRRLAFIRILHRLGARLDTAGAMLDEPRERRRAVVQEQIDELDRLIRRATDARRFLEHVMECEAERPIRDCPVMVDILDRLIDGVSFEHLAEEYRGKAASGSAAVVDSGD